MRLASNPPPFGIMEYDMNSECGPSALIQIKLTDPCAMMLRANADPKPTLCGPAHMPSDSKLSLSERKAALARPSYGA